MPFMKALTDLESSFPGNLLVSMRSLLVLPGFVKMVVNIYMTTNTPLYQSLPIKEPRTLTASIKQACPAQLKLHSKNEQLFSLCLWQVRAFALTYVISTYPL